MENPEVMQKAEFNMAVSYLNRLNSFYYAADMACYARDIDGWFNALIILYRELSTEMSQEDRDAMDREMLTMNNEIVMGKRQSQRFGKADIKPELYMRLHKFEQKLRDITKKAGLQMKFADDATNALM